MIGKKIGSAFAVLALILATAVPAASAHRSEPAKDKGLSAELSVDLFYGGLGNEFTLFVGFTAEDACNEVPPRIAKAKVFKRSDGTLTVKARRIRGVDLFMYKFGGDAFDLIDETCAALFDDDPTTKPLQPIAVGKGRVRIVHSGLDSLDDIGGFHIRNSARGKVTAEDGTTWRVRGHANFDLHEAGFPIGDPAEFQGLRVRKIRRGW